MNDSLLILDEYEASLKNANYAESTSPAYRISIYEEIKKWCLSNSVAIERLNSLLRPDYEKLLSDILKLYSRPQGFITFTDFLKSKLSRNYWALGFDGGEGKDGLNRFISENYWQALNYDKDDNRDVAKRAFKHFSKIKIGDYVIIKGYGGRHDLLVHYAGIVKKIDIEKLRIDFKKREIKHYHSKAPSGSGAGNWNHTILKVERPLDIELLFKTKPFIDQLTQNNFIEMNYPLNQILYGPPGTGKTYHTINRALSIIEGKSEEELKKENRSDIKERFDNLVKSGQIVFTTFHQSMSYEDFIEGLKAKGDKGQISYEIEDGVFKQIVIKANPVTGNFDQVLEEFKKQIAEPEGEAVTIESKSTKFDVVYRGTSVFYIQPHNSIKENPWYPVNIAHVRKVFETGSYEGIYNTTYVREILAYLAKYKGLQKGSAKSEVKEKFVLIIDEINRGNVSQIFGELITLIEEDKRAGKPEALSVTLPYSKERFSVPPNLYLIGTMNTADRSVEALDVALRRRFVFEHMPPRPELLSPQRMLWELYWKYKDADWKGAPFEPIEQSYYEMLKGLTEPAKDDAVNQNTEALKLLDSEKNTIWKKWASGEKDEDQIGDLAKFKLTGLDQLLELINQRIAYLKDEDHQIGHSYFMNVYSKEDLAYTFSKNIIPLLKEYFYNDFGKIRLVLGDGFVKRKDNWKPDFASDDEVLEGTTYELVPIDEGMILDALRITLGHKKGQ